MIREVKSTLGIVRTVKNWVPTLADHAGLKRKRYVCRLRNGLRFFVRPGTDDTRVLFEIHVRKCYAEAVVRPGSTVIDIGANIGCYSISAARHAAKVIACEPHPVNLSILRKNVELNAAHNVEVVPFAISDESTTASLVIPDDENFVGRYSLHPGRGEQSIEVTCLAFDSLLEQTGVTDIDLIKLDCQGSEYEILYGASKTALSRVKQIIAECEVFSDRPRCSIGELSEYLRSLGFTIVVHGDLIWASRQT